MSVSASILVAMVAMVIFLQPSQSAAYAPAFAGAVTSTTADWKPSLRPLVDVNAYLARRNCGDLNDLKDDTFYVHFQIGSTAPGEVAVGDVRIAVGAATGACSSLGPGIVVATGDADVGADLISPENDTTFQVFSQYVEFLEMDGVQGFTRGDSLVVDFDDPAPAHCAGVGPGFGLCDLRLTSILTLASGTIVKTGDADLLEFADTDGSFPESVANSETAGSVTLRYFDANENQALDRASPADTVYVRLGTGAPSDLTGPLNHVANVPVVADLRLTAFGSHAFGTLVAPGGGDLVPVLAAGPAGSGRLVCYPTASCAPGVGLTTDKLLFTWDPAATRVMVGDLMLNAAAGTAGGLVTSGTTGGGQPFQATSVGIGASVFYVDLSPAGLGEEDPVYLNRPTDLGGGSDASPNFRVTALDIRLSVPAGGTGTPGSAVVAGEADLNAYGNVNGAGIQAIKWFDGSRGQGLGALRSTAKDTTALSGTGTSTWDAGEMVYSSGSTTALAHTVRVGNLRINPASYAEGSIVTCSNDENADCKDNITAVPTMKVTGGDGTFSPPEDVYLSTDDEITSGDVRLTPVGAFAVGSVVDCAATPGECAGAAGELDAVTNGCLTGSGTTWQPGESAYQANGACPATISPGTTFTRISPIALPGKTAVAATDPDVNLPIAAAAAGAFKITGADNVMHTADDQMYVSTNHEIGPGDVRVSDVGLSFNMAPMGSRSVVANGDADINSGMTTGDALYASMVTVTNSKFPAHTDVRLAGYDGLAYGSRVAAGQRDFTPRVLTFASSGTDDTTFCLARSDRGAPNQVTDDAFYLGRDCTTTPFAIAAGDARITAVGGASYAVGSMVAAGDADANAESTVREKFFTQVRYIDGSASKAAAKFDSGDLLYVNQTLGVTPDNKLGANDIRLKPTSGLLGGTLVKATDADATQFTTDAAFRTDPDGTGGSDTLRGKFIDRDYDGQYDAGEDVLVGQDSANCASGACSAILRLGDVFLTGSGGGTGIAPPTTPTTTAPPPGVPVLTQGRVTPSACVAASASLTFSVRYSDSLNRAPSVAKLTLNSVDTTMTGSSATYSAGVTYTATVTAPATTNTYPSAFQFTNPGGTTTLAGPSVVVMPSTNVAPTLTDASISPASGPSGTEFTWSVTYTDQNNQTPTLKRVVIDGAAKDMSTTDKIYCDGSVFTYTQTLGAGNHTYAFEFSDSVGASVKLPVTGTLDGPTMEPGTVTPGSKPPLSNNTAPFVPRPRRTPGFEAVEFAAALVLGALVVLVRRRD